MSFLWLVYTDEAGVLETAGVYSTSEKASDVARLPLRKLLTSRVKPLKLLV